MRSVAEQTLADPNKHQLTKTTNQERTKLTAHNLNKTAVDYRSRWPQFKRNG
jgi:hypothetical protein